MNNYSKIKLLILGFVAPLAVVLSCQQYTPDKPLDRVNGTLRLIISVSIILDGVNNSCNGNNPCGKRLK